LNSVLAVKSGMTKTSNTTCLSDRIDTTFNQCKSTKMGIFGDDRSEELSQTKEGLKKSEAARKRLSADLADARSQIAELSTRLAQLTADLGRVQSALRKARQRQKASVERANRFKAKLVNTSSTGL
jgi:chromosome segregation ATPase